MKLCCYKYLRQESRGGRVFTVRKEVPFSSHHAEKRPKTLEYY